MVTGWIQRGVTEKGYSHLVLGSTWAERKSLRAQTPKVSKKSWSLGLQKSELWSLRESPKSLCQDFSDSPWDCFRIFWVPRTFRDFLESFLGLGPETPRPRPETERSSVGVASTLSLRTAGLATVLSHKLVAMSKDDQTARDNRLPVLKNGKAA